MKRFKQKSDSAYARATKTARLSTVNSAGSVRIETIRPPSYVPPRLDSDEDIRPNVLLESLLTQKLEKMVQNCVQSRPTRNLSGEKIIPTFDPDMKECNAKEWLAKIDQLGLVHKWDDYSKIVIMQTRLAGRLDSYDRTWEQWKALLCSAFPRNCDYAVILEELVARRKLKTETFTHYYHEKLAMCHRCRLDDTASLSCIIRGLPADLQSNAKAYKCDTPEEFYTGYLSAFESYEQKNYPRSTTYHNDYLKAENRRHVNPNNILFTSRQNVQANTRKSCYRCNSNEHFVKDCPVPDRRVCKICAQTGHVMNNCPKLDTLIAKNKTAAINIVQDINDIYRKEITVNGMKFDAYLDSGAQLNIVTLKMAEKLKVSIMETDTMLRGFTGDVVPAIGKIKLSIKVDQMDFDTTAEVTHLKLHGDVDMMVGQPIINSKGVLLKIRHNTVILEKDDEEERDDKFKVTLQTDISIPSKGSQTVDVNIIGNTADGNVCTTPKIYDMNGNHFAVPATLTS